MVGGYTENLEKPQKCQNWGVGACSGMGAYSGQYGIIRNTEVRKNIVIVYGNWMAANCRLLNFVIVTLTINLFPIALF